MRQCQGTSNYRIAVMCGNRVIALGKRITPERAAEKIKQLKKIQVVLLAPGDPLNRAVS